MLYLDSIVTNSEGEYDEIDAVLNRYKTLEDANRVRHPLQCCVPAAMSSSVWRPPQDLHKQSEETSSKIEKLRLLLAQFLRDKQLESLMLSSETQQAAKKIEGLSAEAAAVNGLRGRAAAVTTAAGAAGFMANGL